MDQPRFSHGTRAPALRNGTLLFVYSFEHSAYIDRKPDPAKYRPHSSHDGRYDGDRIYRGAFVYQRNEHKLWDYSKRWGNIDGIICPLFSVIWGAVGAAYYYLVHPHILQSLLWLSNNLAFSYFIGYFFGIFTLDLAHSLNITVKLRRFAKENRLVLRYEELKLHIREEQEKRHEKIHYVFPFRTKELSKTLERYHDKLKALTQKEGKEEKEAPPEGQTPSVFGR